MEIKYRIRKRTASGKEQYYVDYKRITEDKSIEEIPWMGGFYAQSEEEAKSIIKRHREYEDLKMRLSMTEEVIYDETEGGEE